MPGKFSLYPDLSVEENLKFFASVFQTTIQENYHLIKDIYQQIEPFKDRKARSFIRRDETEAGFKLRTHSQAFGPVFRRTDYRCRSCFPQRILGNAETIKKSGYYNTRIYTLHG